MANIIITNISKLGNDPQLWEYSSDLGTVRGVNTNEAPVSYLVRFIRSKGMAVDKIIAVTTREAEAALEKLKEMLSGLWSDIPEPKEIVFREDEFAETVRKVSEEFSAGDCVYIDTTGGFRNSSYFLMCVVRILEYSGAVLGKAVYSRFERLEPQKNRIMDVTDLYGMYDLINAVDAFTNYGNSHGLEQYFRGSDEPAVKEVIGAMNDFSDMISLCRTSELPDILGRLNSSLEKLSRTDTDKADIILLKTLIPTVKGKFYMKSERIEYPDVVRWCLDNRFIQQAVTIYVERMPEYFFRNNYITVTDEMRERIKAEKANSHFDISYEMLYNYFIGQEIKRTVGRIDFQTILRTTLEHCPKDFVYSKSNKYHVFFAGLMDSRDARSIISALPEKADDEAKFEDVLKKFMRLRDALYDSSGNRFPPNVFNKNLSAYPVLKEHIGKRPNITAKTVEGFVRSAANDNALFAIFNGTEQKTVVKHQLELVDGLTEGYIREGFALGEGVSAEKMQKILRDILYVKNFIRNKLNHASEDDSVNEEKQKYFSSHGYNTSNELSCDEITEFMKKAIEIKER